MTFGLYLSWLQKYFLIYNIAMYVWDDQFYCIISYLLMLVTFDTVISGGPFGISLSPTWSNLTRVLINSTAQLCSTQLNSTVFRLGVAICATLNVYTTSTCVHYVESWIKLHLSTEVLVDLYIGGKPPPPITLKLVTLVAGVGIFTLFTYNSTCRDFNWDLHSVAYQTLSVSAETSPPAIWSN